MADPQTLAKRAVACTNWRWPDGMPVVSRSAGRWGRGRMLGDRLVSWGRHGLVESDVPPDALPDFADPSALGCLLAIVREATGHDVWCQWMPSIDLDDSAGGWVVKGRHGATYGQGATEIEALVKTLEGLEAI